MTSEEIILRSHESGKPLKILEGATFIGRGLWGNHPSKEGKTVRCSRVVDRLRADVFETLNSIYYVKWINVGKLNSAEITIPAEWTNYE